MALSIRFGIPFSIQLSPLDHPAQRWVGVWEALAVALGDGACRRGTHVAGYLDLSVVLSEDEDEGSKKKEKFIQNTENAMCLKSFA